MNLFGKAETTHVTCWVPIRRLFLRLPNPARPLLGPGRAQDVLFGRSDAPKQFEKT